LRPRLYASACFAGFDPTFSAKPFELSLHKIVAALKARNTVGVDGEMVVDSLKPR
jgi:hypothetical protein